MSELIVVGFKDEITADRRRRRGGAGALSGALADDSIDDALIRSLGTTLAPGSCAASRPTRGSVANFGF